MVLGSRHALSTLPQVQRPEAVGSSRAEMKEWKRQKATTEQENIGKPSDNAEQRLKEYKRKATQAETKRKELELKLEELVQNTKTSNEAMQKQLQQQSAELFESENYCNVLKKALRTAIDSNEQLEKKVKELTEENRVIPRQQSHLTEVSLLYKIQCIERDTLEREMEELQHCIKKDQETTRLPPQLSKIPTAGSVQSR